MKLLYEFGVIMAVTFLGEICHAVLPLPIPASIYGLLLMLFALCTKIIKLEQVKVAGDFLLDFAIRIRARRCLSFSSIFFSSVCF